MIVDAAERTGHMIHLFDGPLQQERDRQMMEGPPSRGFPLALGDPVLQPYILAYDAQLAVDQAWEAYMRRGVSRTTDNIQYQRQ